MREIFKLDYPRYEVEHHEFKTVANPEFDFIRGSFDGILTDKETGKKGVLEIKTTNILQSMQKEKWGFFLKGLLSIALPILEYVLLKVVYLFHDNYYNYYFLNIFHHILHNHD